MKQIFNKSSRNTENCHCTLLGIHDIFVTIITVKWIDRISIQKCGLDFLIKYVGCQDMHVFKWIVDVSLYKSQVLHFYSNTKVSSLFHREISPLRNIFIFTDNETKLNCTMYINHQGIHCIYVYMMNKHQGKLKPSAYKIIDLAYLLKMKNYYIYSLRRDEFGLLFRFVLICSKPQLISFFPYFNKDFHKFFATYFPQ